MLAVVAGLGFSTAQATPEQKATTAQVDKAQAPKQKQQAHKLKETTTKGQAQGRLKKDGTPDRRYKENKKLKKDGTPDKRYKENK